MEREENPSERGSPPSPRSSPTSPEKKGNTMRHEKSCGALVMRRDAKDGKLYILMIRHKAGGHRSFPKGHMEKGETETDTAEREVMEETAVRIRLTPGRGFRRTVHYNPMPGVKKEVVYFLTETAQADVHPQQGEIAEVEWIPLEQAEDALTHENDRQVLRAALRVLRTKRRRRAYPVAGTNCKTGGNADENDRMESAENPGTATAEAVRGKRQDKRKETGKRIPEVTHRGTPERKDETHEIPHQTGHHE